MKRLYFFLVLIYYFTACINESDRSDTTSTRIFQVMAELSNKLEKETYIEISKDSIKIIEPLFGNENLRYNGEIEADMRNFDAYLLRDGKVLIVSKFPNNELFHISFGEYLGVSESSIKMNRIYAMTCREK